MAPPAVAASAASAGIPPGAEELEARARSPGLVDTAVEAPLLRAGAEQGAQRGTGGEGTRAGTNMWVTSGVRA